MIEVSDDPAQAKRQMELFNRMRSRQHRIGELYKGHFRSDAEGIVNDTIKALEDEIVAWKAMLD